MHNLPDFVGCEISGRSGELEKRLVVSRFAQEKFEELRTFEPPVPEQFGVIRTDHYRIERHFGAERFELPDAVGQKVGRVGIRRTLRPRTVVDLFV
ncbi:MAG: hypothetical protein ACK56I_36900, partial [bacterium]